MIVLLLIGIIAAVGIPRFLRSPRSATEQFIGSLNVLIGEGVESAQKTHATQRILFNLMNKKVEVQNAAGRVVGKTISIPRDITVSDVIIDGKSQFGLTGDKRTFYFLINPEGLSQEVRLVLIDEGLRARSKTGGYYEFYLNPFTSSFRLAS